MTPSQPLSRLLPLNASQAFIPAGISQSSGENGLDQSKKVGLKMMFNACAIIND